MNARLNDRRHGTNELARFVSQLAYANLPAPLLSRARQVAADLTTVIAAGMREPEMRRLAAGLAPNDAIGTSTVIDHQVSAFAETAALLHGRAGTFLERDEGNRFSRGHPGTHVFPDALAVAQRQHASGAQVLMALVAGYQVATRIGSVHANRRDAEDALTDEELSRKFLDLGQCIWTPKQAALPHERFLTPERIHDVSTIFQLQS